MLGGEGTKLGMEIAVRSAHGTVEFDMRRLVVGGFLGSLERFAVLVVILILGIGLDAVPIALRVQISQPMTSSIGSDSLIEQPLRIG
jgi:hypothetical protein